MHFVNNFYDGNTRTASGKYHQNWYPGQKQPNRYVFAVVHCSSRKIGGFMPTVHKTCGRCSMENEEVLDAVCANLSERGS
jgi:hypothetical protein